jgi:hypothetical protein
MLVTALLAVRRLGLRTAIPSSLLAFVVVVLVWLRRAPPPLSAGRSTPAAAKVNASMARLDAELRRAMDPRWFRGAGERIADRSPPAGLQVAIDRVHVRPSV